MSKFGFTQAIYMWAILEGIVGYKQIQRLSIGLGGKRFAGSAQQESQSRRRILRNGDVSK